MSDTSMEPDYLPSLIDDETCEERSPPESATVPRPVIYASFDKLPTSGYIKPVRLINEFADGVLEWEFPHRNIDYCIEVTASKTLELFEDAIKRPP